MTVALLQRRTRYVGGLARSRGIPPPADAQRKRAPLACQVQPETSAQHARSPAAKLRLRQLGSLRRKSVIRAARPHRARYPLPRTNGRCGFGEGTFAGTRGNDRVAPNPAIPQLAIKREVRPKPAEQRLRTPALSSPGDAPAQRVRVARTSGQGNDLDRLLRSPRRLAEPWNKSRFRES